MTEPPHRLAADAPHGLGGAAIDRKRPIQFRLDGRRIDGYVGDTVLSALLASGVLGAGTHNGDAVVLDARSAPPVVIAGRGQANRIALPMARTPALDGLDLASVGPRPGPLTRLKAGYRGETVDTLDLKLGEVGVSPAPWQQQLPERTLTTDVLVIGGGVAGLSAAAAASGRRVLLVERRVELGGTARFFGSVEGEESPDEAIARLAATVASTGNVEVMTSAEVFGLHGTSALVHRVSIVDGAPHGEVLRVEASAVVIATGSLERLPVFAGNRRPGVLGALEAYRLAERYGVWIGGRAAFMTPHNFTYQFALHARAAGIAVLRVADSRVAPRSRYIDFCKASGVPLAAGLAVSGASRAPRKGGLDVGFSVAIEGIDQDASPLTTDLLVAAGAWQPDLSLWMMGGGGARWDDAQSWFAPTGQIDRIALAGSVTGLRGTAAAIASGAAAITALSGGKAPDVVDRRIDAAYETADAQTPIAPGRGATGTAYLDGGPSFTTLGAAWPRRGTGAPQMVARAVGFSLGDIAAAVELGSVAKSLAGTIAAERCVSGAEIVNRAWRVVGRPVPAGVPPIPDYLVGRFGQNPTICRIGTADERTLRPGCLLFPSSDLSDPRQAIGVIYAASPGGQPGGLAIMGATPDTHGATVFVRDVGGPIAARIIERLGAR